MSARKELPPPDASDTDPDAALRQRFSLGGGQPTAAPSGAPGPFSGAGLPGEPAPSQILGQQSQRKAPATRPDPEGMRRASYYISREASDALDEAAATVVAALGGDIPKHLALSALITAGAERAAEVATALSEARTAALADRLKALQTDD